MLTKVSQWVLFSKEVIRHIRKYVVAQYGDLPDRQVENFNMIKVQAKLEYYVFRIGRGQRGKKEEIRDMLKIAHMACYGYAILTAGGADKWVEQNSCGGDTDTSTEPSK